MRISTRVAALTAATALTLGGVALAAPAATAAEPKGKAKGYTSVVLDATAAGAILGPLGGGLLTPGAIDLGAGSVGFPIVGNSKGGVIKHVGGLSFSGANTVEIRNFYIDTNELGPDGGALSAEVFVNGDSLGRAPVFNVSGTLEVTLTDFAAGALSALVLDSPGAIPGGFLIGQAAVNAR